MAIAFVQDSENTGSTTTLSVTWGGNTTSGNLLVAVVSLTRSSGSNVTCTPPTNWLTAGTAREGGTGSGRTYIFYYPNCPAQAATGNFTASNAGGISIVVAEFSGLKTSSVIDQTDTHTNGAATSDAFTTGVTTTQADELLIAAFGGEASAIFSNPTNSFTLQEQAAQADSAVALCYRIVAATGNYTTGLTSDTSIDFANVLASFKMAVPVDPSEDTVWVRTKANFVRTPPPLPRRQQSSESTHAPIQPAEAIEGELAFISQHVGLPMRIPHAIQPTFTIGQDIPDFQDVAAGVGWEAKFANPTLLARRAQRVGFSRMPLDVIVDVPAFSNWEVTQVATPQRQAASPRVHRVFATRPLTDDIVDVAEDLPWEVFNPPNVQPLKQRQPRRLPVQGGENFDVEPLPDDEGNDSVRIGSVRPRRRLNRPIPPAGEQRTVEHEIVPAPSAFLARRRDILRRVCGVFDASPDPGLQDDSERFEFGKSVLSKPARRLRPGGAVNPENPPGVLYDEAVFGFWVSPTAQPIRAPRHLPRQEQADQQFAVIGMVDVDGAMFVRPANPRERATVATPIVEPWLYQNLVIVVGPYYAVEGDIYHAGATAGDLKTE